LQPSKEKREKNLIQGRAQRPSDLSKDKALYTRLRRVDIEMVFFAKDTCRRSEWDIIPSFTNHMVLE
jgi:hypothetical protein